MKVYDESRHNIQPATQKIQTANSTSSVQLVAVFHAKLLANRCFLQPLGTLEKAPHLPQSPNNLHKQVPNQQLQIKGKKCSIQKNKSTIWNNKKQWQTSLLLQINKLKGKALLFKKNQLKSQYCRLQLMKTGLRKETGKKRLPQQLQQTSQEKRGSD